MLQRDRLGDRGLVERGTGPWGEPVVLFYADASRPALTQINRNVRLTRALTQIKVQPSKVWQICMNGALFAPSQAMGRAMESYTFLVEDDRYAMPLYMFVAVRDQERARQLASEQLVGSPHRLSIEVYRGDKPIHRVSRVGPAPDHDAFPVSESGAPTRRLGLAFPLTARR